MESKSNAIRNKAKNFRNRIPREDNMWDKTVFYHIPRTLLVYSINTAFNSCKDKDYYFPGEMHNFWEMVYIKKGKAIITKNDKIYRLNEGETAIHPPMEFHRIMSDGEEFEIIVISFSSDSDILYSLPNGVIRLDKKLSNELYEIFEEIKTAFNMNDVVVTSGKNAATEQMAVCRFEHFLLNLIAKEKGVQSQVRTHTAKLFSLIVEVMNDNIGKNLSVEQIARLCGMSVSNLKKITRKHTGGGVNKHFTTLKIMRATSMLENGMNVSEVSEILGFSSPAYFSYVFKRETGTAPINVKK